MIIVDFHNHYYPPAYLDAIRRGPSNYTVTEDDEGNPVLHSPGDKNYIVPGHRDLDARLAAIDAAGVHLQVLTFTAPGTLIESPARSAELAPLVNDRLASVVAEHGRRFAALATLPLNSPTAATVEFERATTELGLPGAMVFGNVNGTPLSDQRFWPIYERASDAGAVIYIHPTYPMGVEAMTEYWLMPLVGFLFDTTLDRGYEAFEECREHISKPPSTYLRRFHYDTVNFDPKALQLAIDFTGVDRIVAGSDYPHQIGSLEKMTQSIDALGLPDDERERILGTNALELLGGT
jgi:aminocarboxymuconate-semialdehyde decarboxylase